MPIPKKLAERVDPEAIQRRENPISRESFLSDGNGGVTGIANVMGGLDSYRSVIFPGAYRDTLGRFVDSGCILEGHDWTGQSIGYIDEAKEEGRHLVSKGSFYPTRKAQDVRQVCSTRMEAGKKVELSVGFHPLWSEVRDFRDGYELWRFAEDRGYDMGLFDPAIKDDKGWCWGIPVVKDLIEKSVVHRGASPGSELTDVRSATNNLKSGVLATRLEDHLELALAAVAGVTRRIELLRDRRETEGRDFKGAEVQDLITALSGLQKATTPIENTAADELSLRIDNALLDARLTLLRP